MRQTARPAVAFVATWCFSLVGCQPVGTVDLPELPNVRVSVTGEVRSTTTHATIPGARVFILHDQGQLSTLADGDGRYSLDGIVYGCFRPAIRAEAAGYLFLLDGGASINCSRGQVLDIELMPAS